MLRLSNSRASGNPKSRSQLENLTGLYWFRLRPHVILRQKHKSSEYYTHLRISPQTECTIRLVQLKVSEASCQAIAMIPWLCPGLPLPDSTLTLYYPACGILNPKYTELYYYYSIYFKKLSSNNSSDEQLFCSSSRLEKNTCAYL